MENAGGASRWIMVLFGFVWLLLQASDCSTTSKVVSSSQIQIQMLGNKKTTYIVHMDNSAMPASLFSSHTQWYSSKITSCILDLQDDVVPHHRILYTYHTAFHGFAARLTQQESHLLQSQDGVVSVLPETVYHLHTTRSPSFLGIGLGLGLSPQPSSDHHDVIVGVLDTGIWPDSQSFNDSGLPPVPARWRGACETGRGFTSLNCNRKIVGARVFYRGYEAVAGKINETAEYKSPRDQDGHGTHTASTVAGSPVRSASLLGYAPGTASGMAPGARIAVYKVCWVGGCFSSDILSAVDRAVADGVDVLSISLGGGVSSYYRDSLSVATFGAMEMGVFVSCSAGNGGPDPVSLTNVAPWVTTVGASTMDRDFPATVDLGSGYVVNGVSIYKGKRVLSPGKKYSLVYLGNGTSNIPEPSSLCLEGSLDPKSVRGKIVICDRGISPRVQKGQVVKDAGGVGMILANTAANGEELVADSHLLPAVGVGQEDALFIKKYTVGGNATATFRFLGTRLGGKPSPAVAAFSSRGPSILTVEILKPDVVAPGVNILAAWTGLSGPSGLPTDSRRVKFNILSGTSMSCPHVSGVATLIRARHPSWSPAAVKSALMTTAYVHERAGGPPIVDVATARPSGPYDHGSGHINPVKALNPGLVYDIDTQGYYEFLCSTKLTPTQLKVFSKSTKRECMNTLRSPGDLNYPAISAIFWESSSNVSSTLSYQRTVTNVGAATSNYLVRVSKFKGVVVSVEPRKLHFTAKNQKLTYKVTFGSLSRQAEQENGYLVWKDGVHRVRSPIVVTWLTPI